MGTRNLTCIVANSKMQIAQYGQWDGYPSCAGVGILAWLSDPKANFDRLKEAALNTTRMEHGPEDSESWVEMDKEDGLVIPHSDFSNYPSFSRDMGFEVLEYLVSTENPIVVMDEGFAQSSLFCEWAYVIDLDNMTLEVYEGFNNTPLAKGERFYTDETPTPDYEGADIYYPVALAKSYDLNNLPSEAQFLAVLEPRDGE